MPSFEQRYYCRDCQKYTTLIDNKCKYCKGNKINKSWSVRFKIFQKDKEIYKRLSGYETKKSANEEYIKYITTNNLQSEKEKTYPFKIMRDEYFNYCNTENGDQTLTDKKDVFSNFITPHFKNRNVEDITKAELSTWQTNLWNSINPLTKQNYSRNYLIKIRGFFHHFLNYCESIHDIPNKLRLIKAPKKKESEKAIRFWEQETFNTFINTIDDILWKTLWTTFFYTGARFNEIRALNDSDLTERTLIQYTLNKKGSVRQPTKNKKILEKKTPIILLNQINEYKKWKEENNISTEFLFGGDIPLAETTIRNHLTNSIKEANLPYINPHGFRHSYVSKLVHLGVSTKIIAELINDNEEQVIKTYGHLYKGAKDTAIELLDKNS